MLYLAFFTHAGRTTRLWGSHPQTGQLLLFPAIYEELFLAFARMPVAAHPGIYYNYPSATASRPCHLPKLVLWFTPSSLFHCPLAIPCISPEYGCMGRWAYGQMGLLAYEPIYQPISWQRNCVSMSCGSLDWQWDTRDYSPVDAPLSGQKRIRYVLSRIVCMGL